MPDAKLNIVITGGTGFLGSHLVTSLIAAGHDVIVLKRSSSDTSRLAEVAGVRMFDVDVSGLNAPFDFIKADIVLHAATNYGTKGEDGSFLLANNVQFPLELLEASIRGGAKTFVNTDTSLHHFTNPYALSKLQFREWGRHLANQGGINFVNVRLEHMFGPRDNPSKFARRIIEQCLQNVPEIRLTQGDQKRDFIYIDDVIAAYMHILHADPQTPYEEYEVGSGSAVSIRDFVQRVRQLTQSSTTMNFGAIPYRTNEVMQSEANIQRLTEMGWSPRTGLNDGLQKTIDHVRLHGVRNS
ncbi:MAG TPA: NAD(P)-dependent oxidoreductase [Thermoanaerobaculia bacterium]|nr:NAD(P)-dependent oxidoreductase [Thermoanaerobaculia bacterium]